MVWAPRSSRCLHFVFGVELESQEGEEEEEEGVEEEVGPRHALIMTGGFDPSKKVLLQLHCFRYYFFFLS